MSFPRKREVPPPLVRDLAAEGIPVRLTCGVLGFSAQAYYAWLALLPRDVGQPGDRRVRSRSQMRMAATVTVPT